MGVKLPRFVNTMPLVDNKKGTPTVTFHQWWQEVVKQLEASINDISNQVADIQAALDAANLAQAAADSAQTTANSALGVAKLSNSGTDGLTITATDAGTDSSIIISNHTRLYGDGTSVSVTGDTLTALAYETLYYIYYDDSGFAGGAVTYVSTTSSSTAAQTGARHLVGSVTTPAAAGADTGGGVIGPPGSGDINEQ